MEVLHLRRMEDIRDAACAPDQERGLRTFDDIVGWFTHEGVSTTCPLLQPGAKAPYVFVNDVRLRTP